MKSLRDEIFEFSKKMHVYPLDNIFITEILKMVEKRIDKVERDYKNVLTPWGKTQPMKEMYPKQMDALDRVRKELLGINKEKKKKKK